MAVEKPPRELSVDKILTQSFRLYSSRFIQFFTPFLITGLITGVLIWAVFYSLPLPALPEPEAPFEEIMEWLLGFLATVIPRAVLIAVISGIIGFVALGMVVKYTSDLIEKGDSSLGESFSFTISKLASLLGAELVAGVLVVIGFVCLIVPGIILGIMFSLVVPVIIIEQKGVFESLGRSRRLVSKRWGETFLLFLLVGLITSIPGWIVSLVAAPFDPTSFIVSPIVATLIQPIFPVALVLFYYSMIARESELAAIT